MVDNSAKPILQPEMHAEHVGSLLRPDSLFKKREALGPFYIYSSPDLKETEDEAIKYVVKLQKDAGMQIITDGELRRRYFYDGVFENLDGMTKNPQRPMSEFKPYIPHIKMMSAIGITHDETFFCDGKVKRARPFFTEDFKYLKGIVEPEDVKNIKVTMCPPTWFHQRHGSDWTYDHAIYKNDDEYFEDIGNAYREEIKDLYELGCRRIQLDDPTFCYFCSESMISGMQAYDPPVDHEALLDTYIRALNACTRDRPSDLIVSVHCCRGNFKGGVWFSEGGYDRIAHKFFGDLDVDRYLLEYDTERAGNFEPLKELPLNKTAVLGLVTTKSGQLESVDTLKAHILEAAEIMSKSDKYKRTKEEALTQLAVGTQCGFASVWEGNPITEEDQKKKLELLTQVAKEVWN